VKICSAQSILDQLDGATISNSFVEDENGVHICLADGRQLIVIGEFLLSIVRSTVRMH
jgi:hypothetical protein